MPFYELIGWLAAGLTLLTFSMRTMIPLRMVAIASNVAFIAYSALAEIYPALALHCCLLPFNLWRLYQMKSLVARAKRTELGALDIEWIKPVADARRFKAGRTIFEKGDRADSLYYIVEGRIRLPEVSVELGPNTLFGEIAFFTDDLRRLYFENPEFGYYLARIIATRLSQNVNRLEGAAAPAPPSA